jgi:pheromone shutdown protein TraB
MSAFVEGLKQREIIELILGVFREEVPLVYQALIGERDLFMAESIENARCKSLIAVVGMAHMAGIERTLRSKGYTITSGVCSTKGKNVQ